MKDLTGQVFGMLTVTGRAPDGNGTNYVRYYAKCVCGRTGDFLAENMRAGRTRSCGCQQRRHRGVIKQAKPEQPMLTKRQQRVLVFVRTFLAENQRPPTRAEISGHFGWSSANAAECHLKALCRKGAIRLRPGTSRGIEPV